MSLWLIEGSLKDIQRLARKDIEEKENGTSATLKIIETEAKIALKMVGQEMGKEKTPAKTGA